MSTQIGWLIEDKVIYVKISSILTRTMLGNNANFLVDMLDAQPDGTYIQVIIDTLDVKKYAMGLVELRKISKPFVEHSRLGLTIDVTSSSSTQTVGRVVNIMARQRWVSFSTMADALLYLKKTYPDLGSLDVSVLSSFEPLIIHE